MSNIGSSLDHTLKSRAQTLHANDAALEAQQKQLSKETEKMRKETDKLKKVADDGAMKVKELGNVQNWAEMLERDFLVLSETMRLVKKGDRESGWRGEDDGWETSDGSSSWSGSEKGSEDGEDRTETGLPRVTEYERAWAEVSDTADEEPAANGMEEHQERVDGDGDITMEGLDEIRHEDKGKGKEIEQHADAVETISSTTMATGSGSASNSDPSKGSVHTTASTTSGCVFAD